ncbi:MAG TPA: hypothetical protein VH855_07730 [Acetobacteraceae bacterium]
MASYVFYGHGGREAGTSSGTYVVPPGVTIYFFALDSEILYDSAAAIIRNTLLRAHPNEMAVQGVARDIKRAWDKVPNYKLTGDSNLPDPTGVYLVGTNKSGGPAMPLLHGSSKYLSDLIGGAGKGGVLGNIIYWMACRAAPDNSNNIDDNADAVTSAINGNSMTCIEQASAQGRSPSAVKMIGSWH